MTETPESGPDKPETDAPAESESTPPAAEDARSAEASKPETTPSETAPEAGGHETQRLLGIPVHNLIFVGIVLGFLLGWGTFTLDHEDTVVLTSKELIHGKVKKAGDVYVIQPHGGAERRVPVAEVAELKPASEKDSAQTHATLVWWYDLFGAVIFMGALKMLIAPLIFASIVAGVVSLKDLDQLKSIGGKTFGFYILSTTCAVLIGLVAVIVIAPGKKAASQDLRKLRQSELDGYAEQYRTTVGESPFDADKSATAAYRVWVAEQEARKQGSGHEAERFAKISRAREVEPRDMLRDQLIKPMLENPFSSLNKKNSLGIITFALLLGIAIVVVGPEARPVAQFFSGLNAVMLKITNWLMSLAPICIAFLVAKLIAESGPNVFGSLLWYCLTVIVGIVLHVGVLVTIAKVFGGVGPAQLWAGIREAWLVAFTTRSSAATLPVTMRCVTQNLGVSERVANFGLPVGATMNMDGTALYEGVAVIFLIQIYQGLPDVPIELGGAVTFIIFVTAVMASVGAAAVPDAGLVTMVLVANAVGLPVYYIPLIFAVDAFLDMFRTSTNVLGDSVGTLVVQRFEDRRLGVT